MTGGRGEGVQRLVRELHVELSRKWTSVRVKERFSRLILEMGRQRITSHHPHVFRYTYVKTEEIHFLQSVG